MKNQSIKNYHYFFIILSILFFFVFIWGVGIEPNLLIVKHYKIQNKNLAGLKIVFTSDFHLKKSENQKLKKIVKKINSQNPDIVLLGGDFVNCQSYKCTLHPQKIAKEIGNIKAKYGVYSVLGNHDYLLDANAIRQFLSQYNVTVLINQNSCINISNNRKLCISGFDCFSPSEDDINEILKPNHLPIILLSHSPDVFPEVPDFVDLTLAGHTHGGQINIPFYGPIFVPSDYGTKYAAGLIKEKNKKMIVSKGIGTSSIHIRFNCLPEIVVIDFVNK